MNNTHSVLLKNYNSDDVMITSQMIMEIIRVSDSNAIHGLYIRNINLLSIYVSNCELKNNK